MPQHLKPDQFTLSLDDGTPTIALHDVTVLSAEGWSFLNRATLLVADGPGDEGFLLSRVGPDGDAAPAGWDDAVASTGSVRLLISGAVVVAPVIE